MIIIGGIECCWSDSLLHSIDDETISMTTFPFQCYCSISLKWKGHHGDNFVITEDTEGCLKQQPLIQSSYDIMTKLSWWQPSCNLCYWCHPFFRYIIMECPFANCKPNGFCSCWSQNQGPYWINHTMVLPFHSCARDLIIKTRLILNPII